MKLKDVIFAGFTKEELAEIRKVKGTGEGEMSLTDSQDIADIIGSDVMSVIVPGGQAAIIKAGE